jgi:hypothetical protein
MERAIDKEILLQPLEPGRSCTGRGGVGALLIGLLAAIGVWPDPNPNPIGPGLLLFFTFWPAVICFAIGAFRTWRSERP